MFLQSEDAPIYDHIIVCFREEQKDNFFTQKLPSRYKRVDIYQDEIPPTLYEMFDSQRKNLLIIDDLFAEAFESEAVRNCFTSGRHRNITSFITTQNLFAGGKYARSISLNANYLVIFKTRDLQQLQIISKQIFGDKKGDFLRAAYKDGIANYNYLIIDCSPHHNNEEIRVRTNVFSELPPNNIICYVDKSSAQ
jgi:hypothetical protein